MRYARGRRLTEAARRLAEGAPDISHLAHEIGYNSHEAFSRAFRDAFRCTPESVRAARNADALPLLHPIRVDETPLPLTMPRREQLDVLLIAGLGCRYTCESSGAIPSQWQRFLPFLEDGLFRGQSSRAAYGVICNSDDEGNFDYICGVVVSHWARCKVFGNHVPWGRGTGRGGTTFRDFTPCEPSPALTHAKSSTARLAISPKIVPRAISSNQI